LSAMIFLLKRPNVVQLKQLRLRWDL